MISGIFTIIAFLSFAGMAPDAVAAVLRRRGGGENRRRQCQSGEQRKLPPRARGSVGPG